MHLDETRATATNADIRVNKPCSRLRLAQTALFFLISFIRGAVKQRKVVTLTT